MSGKIKSMFHPGGFGESNESHDRQPDKVDPCLIRPIVLLIAFYGFGDSFNPWLATWFWVVCMAHEHGLYSIWLYCLQFSQMVQ